MDEKFKVLRDDRKALFRRLDHVDDQLNNYRADIRVMHDQIAKSVFEKIREVSARSLSNEISIDMLKQSVQDTVTRYELLLHSDFRDQSVSILKLQENFNEFKK